jgi:hypothetical protein
MRGTIAAAAVLLLVAAACSGGGDDGVVEVGGDGPLVTIVNSELVVGRNRFVMGVLDADFRPVVDARVRLKFSDLSSGGRAIVKGEVDAVSRVPARDAGLTEEVIHVHSDGTRHVHLNAGDDVGVYTADVTFDAAGLWKVEARVESEQPKLKRTFEVRFNVLPQGLTPAIGSPAPRSRNLTAADVADIAEIDSSANPSAEMHTSTIADAIAANRPALVLFAVPGYCESRFCGPEMEIMRKLYPRYRDRVEFIHVEFYTNPGSPSRQPVDAVREWNLRSEPWFFLIDSRGLVAAKFEGPTSMQELEEALQRVLAGR